MESSAKLFADDTSLFSAVYDLQIYYSPSDRDLKSSQVIVSDKSNLARKVDFLLKSGFQIMTIFIPLKVGYLVIIVVNFGCK